jgi:hypothetical protein
VKNFKVILTALCFTALFVGCSSTPNAATTQPVAKPELSGLWRVERTFSTCLPGAVDTSGTITLAKDPANLNQFKGVWNVNASKSVNVVAVGPDGVGNIKINQDPSEKVSLVSINVSFPYNSSNPEGSFYLMTESGCTQKIPTTNSLYFDSSGSVKLVKL